MFPLLPAYHDGTAPTTAASVIAACKQVCNADPRVTGTLAVAAATAGRGFTTAYRNEVLSRYEMLKLAHILSRVNQRSHTGGVCPTQPKRCSRSDPFDTIWAIMGAYDPEREGA